MSNVSWPLEAKQDDELNLRPFPFAWPKSSGHESNGTPYVWYNRSVWLAGRDLETDLRHLRKSLDLSLAASAWQRRRRRLYVGDLHRWLDGRDGFPNWVKKEDERAYLADREEYARALLAAAVMAGFPEAENAGG